MKKLYTYLKVLALLIADIVHLFGFKYICLQALLVVSSITQLACFLLIIRLVSSSTLDFNWFLIASVMLAASIVLAHIAQSKLLVIAIEYERHWLCRFAFNFPRQQTEGMSKRSFKQQSRHMGTILRNASNAFSKILIAFPLIVGLIYLAPFLSLMLVGLLLISVFPLQAVNKTSSRSFQSMQALSLKDRMDGREAGYGDYTSHSTLLMYENMLRAPMRARLIIDLITVFAVSTALLFLLNEKISLSDAVVFLVGSRFLLSNVSAIASAFTALNRFYGTLYSLVNDYFSDTGLMKISNKNFDLENFYQEVDKEMSLALDDLSPSTSSIQFVSPYDFEGRNLAVISMNARTIESDLTRFFPNERKSGVFQFLMNNGDFQETGEPGYPLSFPLLAQMPFLKGKFDYIAISPSLILFETTWHKSILFMINNMLKPGGRLIVPMNLRRGTLTAYGFNIELLEKWLEVYAEPYLPGLITLQIKTEKSVPRSALTWLSEHGPNYIRRTHGEEVEAQPGDFSTLGMRETELAFSKVTAPFDGFAKSPPPITGKLKSTEYLMLEYLSVGAGHRFSALKTTLLKYMKKSDNLRILDHGSASGLIPCQLLFESEFSFDEVTVVEPSDITIPLAYDFFNYLKPAEREKIAYIKSRAEDYKYEQTYHLISFVHMFFLIDEAERSATLARAIAALDDDGVVLIWDIPKNTASTTNSYFDRMMYNEDIEKLCEPYNIIAYLNPKNFQNMDRSTHSGKPIIYVIQKKGNEKNSDE